MNFARNLQELVQELSSRSGVTITRRSIQRWRRDPRYKAFWPPSRANGSYKISEYLAFMLRFGLKRADEVVNRDEVPEERRAIRDWKEHREKLMCSQLERSILRDDGKLLIATELEIALGQLIVGISVALDHFAPAASRFVVGLRDIHDVQAKLQTEIDAVKQRINAAHYLDDCIDEVAQSFPFDAATEEIYKRIGFSGEDHDAFVDLVRCSTIAALRAIGKRALPGVTEKLTRPASA